MTPQLLQVLQDQFLGKQIIVPLQERDNKGKLMPFKYSDVLGQCTFIGENKILNIDLQVTVDGMPIQIKHINDIKLFTPPLTIKSI
jgi:hypothetical protein